MVGRNRNRKRNVLFLSGGQARRSVSKFEEVSTRVRVGVASKVVACLLGGRGFHIRQVVVCTMTMMMTTMTTTMMMRGQDINELCSSIYIYIYIYVCMLFSWLKMYVCYLPGYHPNSR